MLKSYAIGSQIYGGRPCTEKNRKQSYHQPECLLLANPAKIPVKTVRRVRIAALARRTVPTVQPNKEDAAKPKSNQ
ncbi:hypothetical protein evm_005651 [Chilo suppressalis]|nr:hypothetical protein evm_005651 [Chilo suppressalis]